ncbi:hypothetical protein K504DRAFT_458929 [Pleomassaria siparia CBS 279.74]|uniref:Uncharacterized protein n=1 Tax=Pleomassaria siparia CBS 279.74 TaxID=1314801 RepID=A0A6G1K1X6_9PLEO|nr:hypothetical protein K504DRAFT_458929 [Pleomassaria siparia CBS 279.74]
MSATALPITSERFAAALRELPVSSLHAKVSELQNAIAHLEESNKALEEFVREENDQDCYEALMENKEVVLRNRERIELIRKEVVELRGLPWTAEEGKTTTAPATAGEVDIADSETGLNGIGNTATTAAASTNATATGRPQEQTTSSATTEEEEGVFL